MGLTRPVRDDTDFGLILDRTRQRVHGYNGSVGGTAEVVWPPGGSYTWLQTASQVRVDGDDADDNPSGAGARSVRVWGLRSTDGALVSEVLATNGTGEGAASTNSYIRINYAAVEETGTADGNNQGQLDIETTGDVLLARIRPNMGGTQQAIWSTPVDTQTLVRRIRATGNEDEEEGFNICIWVRKFGSLAEMTNGSAPFTPFVIGDQWEGVKDWDELYSVGLDVLPPFSDIYVEAEADENNHMVTASIEMIQRATHES